VSVGRLRAQSIGCTAALPPRSRVKLEVEGKMRSALLAASLVLGGCAHTPQWTELTSRHFVLRTNLAPRMARTALRQFELTYSALETLAFASNPPHERIDFILFRDEESFRDLAPHGATGYFMPHQLDEPEPLPTIAMFGEYTESTQRRFTHELTHRFMDHQLHAAPPWLEEGLAEYYSTMKLGRDEVMLGLLPNKKLFRLDLVTTGALAGRYVETRVELGAVPSVKELLAADEETFHRSDHEVAYYFASWTLVHMLLHGPHAYRPRFTHYVSELTMGTPAETAWQEAFGDVDLARLDQQFRAYVIKLYLDEKRLRVRVPADSAVLAERRLRPDEVHLLFARVRPWDCRENIFAAGRELELARTLAGDAVSPELHFWRALYAERWRRFQEAEQELDRALLTDPQNERYWLALAELIARPDRQDVLEVARLDAAVAHLTPLATTGEALNFLAHYYADKGDKARGLVFALRATEVAPDCRDCAETLAALRNLTRPLPAALDVYTRPAIQ
jgi:hypothetical protein